MQLFRDHDLGADARQLDYVLRRAEQESIAEIRSLDQRAADSHAVMAGAYRQMAAAMLSEIR